MNLAEQDPEFETLLEYLKDQRGFDFTGYKRASLIRRVCKRMQEVNCKDFKDYRDYLEVTPEEFGRLFNTILINVTGFFRDKPAWDFLAAEVIPQILERKGPDDPIRAWSAGCASGEEAYSLTILLAEALGQEAFSRQVKIYATDIDEDALNQARQADYTAKALEAVPEEWRSKYFEQAGDHYVFGHHLRRSVIFGRHDVTLDAPISNIDLLICRNTLMYFNAEIQRSILTRFHFALADEGALFLGKAEMLLTPNHLFTPVELRYRIFHKAPQTNLRYPLFEVNHGAAQPANRRRQEKSQNNNLLLETVCDLVPVGQLVVDAKGNLAAANAQARQLFGLSAKDLNRPLSNLEISYRPLDLRSCLDRVYADYHPITVSDVKCRLNNGTEETHYEVKVAPILINRNQLLGASITFADVTRYHHLQEELERSRHELETTNEELQSTNEELETTNEELETTNEELQSTNEELETMNEELQSTNEELETMNEELHQRTREINKVNTFLNSILSSVRVAVIVIDDHDRVLIWNRKAEDLWGARADEVCERSFFSLDIGLPVGEFKPCLRQILAGAMERKDHELRAVNRRGQAIHCRVTLSPLLDPLSEATDSETKRYQGVILLIEEDRR